MKIRRGDMIANNTNPHQTPNDVYSHNHGLPYGIHQWEKSILHSILWKGTQITNVKFDGAKPSP